MRIRRLHHGQEAELVDHLDELRSRIVVALTAFAVALGLCFWQSDLVLATVNAPLHGKELLTLGVAEPFTTTVTLSAYAAIVLTLPVLLYQAYAFVGPAFTKRERKIAVPLLAMVPLLFLGGVLFAYFLVIPAALQFLLHFNADQFRIELRAREYYSFAATTMVAVGILFQVPVGILALTRLGVTTPAGLRARRRYAYLLCAVLAAALPGVDPVTMLIEMVPLLLLYEASIVLAALFGHPGRVSDPSPSPSGG
jgi:sec-independent protein translocase protein TatC